MTTEPLPTAVPDVIHQKLADGAVLFLPSEEIYFGLNEVGSLIWSLLPPQNSDLDSLVDALASRFPDVERSVLESDTRELLDELLRNKLVTPTSGAGRNS